MWYITSTSNKLFSFWGQPRQNILIQVGKMCTKIIRFVKDQNCGHPLSPDLVNSLDFCVLYIICTQIDRNETLLVYEMLIFSKTMIGTGKYGNYSWKWMQCYAWRELTTFFRIQIRFAIWRVLIFYYLLWNQKSTRLNFVELRQVFHVFKSYLLNITW